MANIYKIFLAVSLISGLYLTPMQSRDYLQVAVLPIVFFLALRIRLFNTTIPRSIVVIAVAGSAIGAVFTHFGVSLSPGAFLVYNTAERELGQLSKIYRDRLRRAIGGGDGIRLVGVAQAPIADAIAARRILNSTQDLGGVVWGDERGMKVALREYVHLSLSDMPPDSVANEVALSYGVSDIFIALSIPGFGISHGTSGATVYFLSRFIRGWAMVPQIVLPGASSDEFEVAFESLGRKGARWRSMGHLAVPLWLSGTAHLLRAIDGRVFQRSELRCAKARFKDALKMLGSRENLPLELAIRNNLAVALLVQGSYGIDGERSIQRAKKHLKKGVKLLIGVENRGAQRTQSGDLIRLNQFLISSFRLTSSLNLAESRGKNGTNGGLETPPKQQNPDEPNQGISDQ